MPVPFGYGQVPDSGFQGFVRRFEEGPWSEIPAADPEASRLTGPLLSGCRLLLREGAVAMTDAYVVSMGDERRARDANWDQSQRALAAILDAHESSPDPEVSAAARRISQRALMRTGKGRGLAQNQLKYSQEVSFGTAQAALLDPSIDPQSAADIAKLQLHPYFAEIATATQRLSEALDANGGSRFDRITSARELCVQNFNAVHLMLTALEENASDAERKQIDALLAPLEALLEQRPNPAAPAAKPAVAGDSAQAAAKPADALASNPPTTT